MKSRERVLKTLEHKEPDRIPIDLGSAVTSIHKEAYIELKNYLGLNGTELQILDHMQQVVEVDEPILQRFNADTRHIHLKPAKGWQRFPDGAYVDEWGIKYRKPKGSHYYDPYEHPLSHASVEDLDKYNWPDPDDPHRIAGLKEKAEEQYFNTRYAIILGGYGGSLFEHPCMLRGFVQFYMDLISNKDFVTDLLDRLLEYYIRLVKNALTAAGKYVQVIRVGDDLGTQRGPIISLALYRELIKPRQKKLYQFIKEHSMAKLFLHSCGSIYEFIPDFIEIGVDALNPVQVSAKKMDSKKLKQDFGERITFWGGGCDTQRVLPFGTAEEIKEDVKSRIKDLAPGGGFVFTPCHNIQYDVSPEKICTLYDTVIAYGSYPITL